MPWLEPTLSVLAAAGAAAAAATLAGVVRAMRSVPVVSVGGAPPPPRWPTVSVVIPACDEAATLEAAVRSRLADDYPALELVIVDDRSTDATGDIAERLAAEDERVRVVHVTALPPGWLGKLHALDQGVRVATGELLLLSDADVCVAPDALRRAVALLEACALDHLGVVPRRTGPGLLLDAVFAAFFRLVWVAARPWAIPDPRSRAAFGVGAFNLVRRAALDRSPGLEHLRLEQADDVALGVMLKRAGARSALANGRDDLSLAFHRSLPEMARALEKGGARYPLPVLTVTLAALVALELGPWLALVAGGGRLRAAGAAGAALSVAASVAVARWMRHALLPALLAPAGVVLLAWMMLRAGVLAAVRGGVAWRGTFYRTEDLRAGTRLGRGAVRPAGIPRAHPARGETSRRQDEEPPREAPAHPASRRRRGRGA